MDNTSSMYLYVKLNRDASRFLPAESKDGMNSASYEYRNMSTRREHRLCPWKCRLSGEKPFPRTPRKCCQLETRASWWCLLQCTFFSNQIVPSQNRVSRHIIHVHCTFICNLIVFPCFQRRVLKKQACLNYLLCYELLYLSSLFFINICISYSYIANAYDAATSFFLCDMERFIFLYE